MKDKVKILAMFLLLLSISQLAMANCGTTDYSGSTGRLYDMVTYVLTMLFLRGTAFVCHSHSFELLLRY